MGLRTYYPTYHLLELILTEFDQYLVISMSPTLQAPSQC